MHFLIIFFFFRFKGADPMAGSSNPNGTTPGVGGPHLALAAGMPPHPLLASREQELLQNDLYRRACADPALAHQVSNSCC